MSSLLDHGVVISADAHHLAREPDDTVKSRNRRSAPRMLSAGGGVPHLVCDVESHGCRRVIWE
jgi:hypothetical protein